MVNGGFIGYYSPVILLHGEIVSENSSLNFMISLLAMVILHDFA
jgi:hypothetical protein